MGWDRFYDRIFSRCLIIWCHSKKEKKPQTTTIALHHHPQCDNRSFIICFKLQLMIVFSLCWTCNLRMHHIPLGQVYTPHHLGVFHSAFIKEWLLQGLFFSGFQHGAGVSVTFQAQTVVSGGRGFLEKITQQTVMESINNVCSLYELWTMKGFHCLQLRIWGKREKWEDESGILPLHLQTLSDAACSLQLVL